MRNQLLFVSFPYIAAACLIAGILGRYWWLRGRLGQILVDFSSLQATLGNKLFQIGWILLILGHLGGILFARQILLWDAQPWRLYLLETMAFLIGATTLLSLLKPIWKCLNQNTEPASWAVGNTVFLSLLALGLISGLLMAAIHRWGSTWGSVTLSPYLVSLWHRKPAVTLISGLPFLVRVHAFSGFTIVVAFPFSRPALLLILALHRVFSYIARPTREWAHATREAMQRWAKRYDPAPLIWPEEEE